MRSIKLIKINSYERYIGHPSLNHKQRISSHISKLTYHRIGEDIIDGKVRFKEVISQGWNYFRRAIMSYDKDGKRIKGSGFVQILRGEEARNKKINTFGAWG